MMTATVAQSSTEALLAVLHRLHTPDAVIHIGAGNGVGRMHAWQAWDVPNALLIDADEARLAWVRGRQQHSPNWRPVRALLDRQVHMADYHTASNPAESGLLPPAELAALWPNLRSVQVAEMQTHTVDGLLADPELQQFANAPTLWLLVDCVPAQRILQGASTALQRSSVVWARALATDWPGTADGAGEVGLSASLAAQGFRCLDVREGNHPMVREMLFVRDWRAALAGSLQQGALLQEELEVLRGDVDKQRDDGLLIATLRAELSAAQAAGAEAQAQLGEQAAQAVTLNATLDSLREAVRRLTEEKSDLHAECESLRHELANNRAAADQDAARHEETESRMADLNARQKMLNDELRKAEAQLELMKDVLLREAGN
jgi:regulator of replication initiation timing